ncbi:MAG TPA: hypothetical protein VFJ19_05060 [Nocardioidaceae bacterium]|nr:hypothetical protein [Nocardioidaceae bacterium]
MLVLSDGTDQVRVGRDDVSFPGPVLDAAVSPNGTQIAYVDGDGNISTARLDGTGVRVLTSTDPGVRRAHPTFEDGGSEIVFTERGTDGVWRLKEVASDGHDELTSGRKDPTVAETSHDHGRDTAPSATWFQTSHAHVARSVMVFQHRTAKGVAKVLISDRNQRGFGASALLRGRSPAVSPAGDSFAFIAPNGQIDVQTLPMPRKRNGRLAPHPRQITWGAAPTGHLGWSPDGRTLVFSTAHDVETVDADPPPEADHNPTTVVLQHRGVGSLGSTAVPSVGVYSGDAVDLALDVSRAHWTRGLDPAVSAGPSMGLVAANRVTLMDPRDAGAAAVAAVLAGDDRGPVLFVRGGRLDPEVGAEINRILDWGRGSKRYSRVDIVGDEETVPDSVAAAIRAMGYRVRRIDPGDPAVVAASAVHYQPSAYIVVSRTDLPAVLSSVGTGTPVLLTDGTRMADATAQRLNRLARDPGFTPTVYAVGTQAQAAVRTSWPGKRHFRIEDVGGPDPYANSLDVTRSLYDGPGRIAVSTTASWQAALVASTIGPALLIDESHGMESATSDWLSSSEASLRGIYALGGSAGLPDQVGHAVFGPTHFDVVRQPHDIVSAIEDGTQFR